MEAQTWSRLEPDVRRGEILAKARAAFAREGYAPVSMAGIADQVGVTPGLINHYFGPKRALYATVLSEISARLPLMVRTDLGDLSTEEMIAANTHDFLDSIERDQEDWALLFGADAPRDPAIAAIVREVRTAVIERMARTTAAAISRPISSGWPCTSSKERRRPAPSPGDAGKPTVNRSSASSRRP